MKINWKQKLSSRKLWAAIIGVLTGIGIVFGVDGDTITTVSGAVVSVVSLATYIITEGKVDANRVTETVTQVQSAASCIGFTADTDTGEEKAGDGNAE